MTKTAEFGQPLPPPTITKGTCRVCGCTQHHACTIATPGTGPGGYMGERACGWADETLTLCDSPNCIARAKAELNIAPRYEKPDGRVG